MPGKPERDEEISHVLPEAFLTDLLDALPQSKPPRAWSSDVNVLLFFDGFEELLSSSGKENTAIQLLEALELSSHREGGETDPLLLVVGSRRSLIGLTVAVQPDIVGLSALRGEQRVSIRDLYEHWQQCLPVERANVTLQDLCLPFYLDEFGLDDTRNYLSRFPLKGQHIVDDQ